MPPVGYLHIIYNTHDHSSPYNYHNYVTLCVIKCVCLEVQEVHNLMLATFCVYTSVSRWTMHVALLSVDSYNN